MQDYLHLEKLVDYRHVSHELRRKKRQECFIDKDNDASLAQVQNYLVKDLQQRCQFQKRPCRWDGECSEYAYYLGAGQVRRSIMSIGSYN